MKRLAYNYRSIDKFDEIDVVKPRKNARLNESFQYKYLNKKITLNSMEVFDLLDRVILSYRKNFIIYPLYFLLDTSSDKE